MSISVTGTSGTTPTPRASSTPPVGEEEGIFGTEETGGVDEAENDRKAQEKKLLEAQLLKLQQELVALMVSKAAEMADKRELTAQINVLNQKKEKLEAEIKANEDIIAEYTNQIVEFDATLQKERKEVEDLRAQYDAKNEEAMKINQEITDKIAQMLGESDASVKEQKEKIVSATAEAYQKVASGEITEDEVARYVAEKIGNASLATSNLDFASINSMNSQMKMLLSSASNLLGQISGKETHINKLQAQIISGNSAISGLNATNTSKRQELSGVNGEISFVNSEITAVNGRIANIDTRVEKVNAEIVQVNAEIAAIDSGETTPTEDQGTDPVIVPPVIGGVTNPTGEETPTTPPPTANNETPAPSAPKVNPFAAVSYSSVSYANIVQVLELISRKNDECIQTGQAHVEANKQEIRQMFQGLMKK